MKRLTALLLAGLILLTSAAALAVDGSDLAVQMGEDSACVELVSAQRCTFQCEYVNNDPERTVAGFDLACVAMDRNLDISMTETTQHVVIQIAPQSTETAPVIYLTNQNEIAYLCLALQAVYFTDGSNQMIDFAAGEDYNMYYFRII